jgi:phosphoglycolate phosphatase-like HAD superfamily hydrolase
VTDIEAAHAAHTISVGYTNKPSKTAEPMTAGTDTVIPTPATLTEQIT